MEKLNVFTNSEFGEVRIVEVGGKPYAVGVDVASALGYAYPSQAVGDHCEGVVKLPIPSYNQHGAEVTQETNAIPEGDIYRLIFKAADQSRNPDIREKAKRFQTWVFDEVLPSIRKTGTYTVPKARKPRVKPEDNVFRQQMNIAKVFSDMTGVPLGIATATALTVVEERTGLDYSHWRRALPARAEDTQIPHLNATRLGALLGISAQDANKRLETAGWQVHEGKNWRLTESGKAHGEEYPYERNGHSDYRVLWRDSAVDALLHRGLSAN